MILLVLDFYTSHSDGGFTIIPLSLFSMSIVLDSCLTELVIQVKLLVFHSLLILWPYFMIAFLDLLVSE